jgi:hypothetical protein
MTTNFRTLLALALVTGCGVEVDLGPSTADPELYTTAKDQVEGSFGQDGPSITFHFQRIRAVKIHTAINTRDGFTLVDTVVENGIETTTLLGGQYTATGTREEIATLLGPDALAELAAMPEMQLVPALRKELAEAGVDPALLDGMSSVTTGETYCPTRPVDPRRPQPNKVEPARL